MDRLWLEFLTDTLCGLCANTGVVETDRRSPAGWRVRGRWHCICPNGRALKVAYPNGPPSPPTAAPAPVKEG